MIRSRFTRLGDVRKRLAIPIDPRGLVSEDLSGRAGLTILALTITLCAAFMLPILQTPLLGDDSQNSYFIGYLGYNRLTVWQWLLEYNRAVIAGGRFFPGMTVIQSAKFLLTQSALTLKLFNIFAICINVVTFYYLVRSLSNSRVAALSSLLTITTFQIRAFYESFAEITIENQATLELVLLTSLSSIIFAKRSTPTKLVVLVVMYLATCATYETSFLFIALYSLIIVAFCRSSKAAKFGIGSLFAVFVLFVGISFWIRHITPVGPASEYSISLHPLAYCRTLYFQIISALPLTYFLANPYHVFSDEFTVLFANGKVVALSIGVAYFALVAATMLYRRKLDVQFIDGRHFVLLLAVGLMFSVLPGILIPLSQRWQTEIKLGLPYQPAYWQGFGISLVLGTLLERLLETRIIRRSIIQVVCVVSFLAGGIAYITFQCNASILPRYDAAWKFPRQAIEESLSRGALGSSPDGSTIIFDTNYPPAWDDSMGYVGSRYLFYMYTHRRYSVVVNGKSRINAQALCQKIVLQRSCSLAVPNVFYYRVRSDGSSEAQSDLFEVHSFTVDDSQRTFADVSSREVLSYRRAANRPIARPQFKIGVQTEPIINRFDYRLDKVLPTCGALSLSSLMLGVVNPRFANGFYGAEGGPASEFHWSGRASTLEVINRSNNIEHVKLRFLIQTFARGNYLLTAYDGNRISKLPLSLKTNQYSSDFTLNGFSSRSIRFYTNAPRLPSPGDSRDLRFRILDFHIDLDEISKCRNEQLEK